MLGSLTERLDATACALAQQRPVVVGLSGGRDSVALLLMLHAMGCSPLLPVHVNHGIRGAEADADEQFCAALCARLGLPFKAVRVDVPALAQQQGESLETTARLVRRRILKETADQTGTPTVALAHHADDQAETVLFRLARGSAGTRGMQSVTQAEGVTWLRPLLPLSRQDITRLLTEMGKTWRDDSTNAVADVARNRIRHEVLPALNQAMGRDVAPILCRSARLQAETLEALECAVAALPILDPQGRLYLPFVLQQPLPLRKAIILHYLKACGVPGADEALVLRVDSILPPTAPHARLSLPGNFTAIRSHKRLKVEC